MKSARQKNTQAKPLSYFRLIPSSLYYLSAVAVIAILLINMLSLSPLWMALVVIIHGFLSLAKVKE